MTSSHASKPISSPDNGSVEAVWNALVSAFLRHDRETPELLARLIVAFPDEPMGPLTEEQGQQ